MAEEDHEVESAVTRNYQMVLMPIREQILFEIFWIA